MTKDVDNNSSFNELQKKLEEIDEHLVIISKKLDELNINSHKREKHDSRRIRKYISFDPEQYRWIESNIKSMKFASITHAVEWGLHVLKEKLDEGK